MATWIVLERHRWQVYSVDSSLLHTNAITIGGFYLLGSYADLITAKNAYPDARIY